MLYIEKLYNAKDEIYCGFNYRLVIYDDLDRTFKNKNL